VPRSKAISLRREIASIISPRRIRDLARTLQVVKRRRKIDVVALVAALTLGFGASRQRTLALLRRAYERSTGQTLAASAFYARLSSRLALLLKTLVEEAIDAAANDCSGTEALACAIRSGAGGRRLVAASP